MYNGQVNDVLLSFHVCFFRKVEDLQRCAGFAAQDPFPES